MRRRAVRAATIAQSVIVGTVALSGCRSIADLDHVYELAPEGAGGDGGTGGSAATASSSSGAFTTSGMGGGGAGGVTGVGGAGGAGGSGGAGGGPVELCGNGIIEMGEECDDQNGSPGDGCDACQAYCFAGEVEEPTTHHCYLLVTSEKTRDGAKSGCENMGFYLVTITSVEELAFIAPLDDGDDRWLGGLKVGNDWTWDNGEPWGFTAWEPGQPNNNGVCLNLRASSNVWNDDVCSEVHDFICEWTPPGSKP